MSRVVLVEWQAGFLAHAEPAVKVGDVLATQSLHGGLRARIAYPTCSRRSLGGSDRARP